jgi:tellurite resistance protein TerC
VLKLTPLLLVLICVEATDLVFAFDSIPAILAITQDPFLVFTSNALALLGMRALYFAVQGLLSKLRYLHQGLAAILVFVGAKLMLTDYWHVSSGVSLVAILSILATAVGASLLAPEREAALEVDWAPQETPEPEL